MKTVYIEDATHRQLFQASLALDQAVQVSAQQAVSKWLRDNAGKIERANLEFNKENRRRK